MENLRIAVNLILLIYIRQTIEETILSSETQQSDVDNHNTDWNTKASPCQGRYFIAHCIGTWFFTMTLGAHTKKESNRLQCSRFGTFMHRHR